jgi:crotonobetainyl-CoA:carnitine CoA-transferase CaiB-like acyl-CoA transferase
MAGVLSGLKVLDLSKGVAGPMTTMLMADHGAHVTRILSPKGDQFASMAGYRVWQRAKDSLTLDLKNKAERERFYAKVDSADVLVETFKPGVTKKLAIDYATLKARNPGLIYLSITGYGKDTRDAHRPAYDALVAARIGLQYEIRGWPEGAANHMNGQPGFMPELQLPYEWLQGPPRSGPMFTASFWPSLGAFFAASVAVNAALRVRGLTGKGQLVETSLLQGAMAGAWANWLRAERIGRDSGMHSWIWCSRAPQGHYKCADGKWIHNWLPNYRFLLGAASGEDPRTLDPKTDPDRISGAIEDLVIMAGVQEEVIGGVARHDSDFWVNAGAQANIPLQICRPVEEGLNDPLLLSDGCVVELNDPELGPIRQVGTTYRLTACPSSVGNHAARTPRSAALAIKPDRTSMQRPLEGVRVLDLGLAVAGPYGAKLLSDLGADVIKVSNMNDGYWHTSCTSFACSRGKRSIALNLKSAEGQTILDRLIRRADVIMHNMRHGAAKRLKVDYDSIKEINPRMIYCHTRGFERSERESLPGNDQTGCCLAGVQYADGGLADGGRPIWPQVSFGDVGNGFLSAVAMIQALMHRDHTGQGQFVDTSIVYAALLNTSYAYAFPDGTAPDYPKVDRMNYGLSALYRLYETADGWLCIAIASDAEWTALCRGLGGSGLAADSRFKTASDRRTNTKALAEALTAIFRRKSAKEWMAALDAAGAPCEISDPEYSRRMFDDPELQERNWVVAFDHRRLGRLDMSGVPFDFSETPATVQGPPVICGDHSRVILSELGYGDVEIDAFIASGVTMNDEPAGGVIPPAKLNVKKSA